MLPDDAGEVIANILTDDAGPVTINMLPDDVLLEIFDFAIEDISYIVWTWAKLAHVCRRWRHIIFTSPQRLHLRIVCSSRTPTRTSLDIWPPPFPIAICCHSGLISGEMGVDNIIAALEQRDRISEIGFHVPSFVFARFAAVMQEPLPALTNLELVSNARSAPALPETFLGGSVPRLRSLYLDGIPFPALPRLLLSARDLVNLRLLTVPHSGYVSPEAMATCLATLTRLESFELVFHTARARPGQSSRRPPPPTRAVLPALTHFRYQGVSEYLEDLVARINAPQIDNLWIKFSYQPVFELSQLPRFIARTEKLKTFSQANVLFQDHSVDIIFPPKTRKAEDDWFHLMISCKEPDRQLSSMAQVCNSSLPPLPALEYLYIRKQGFPPPRWQSTDNMENTQWLELLRPFAGVRNLYLGEDLGLRVAHALQELTGESVAQVLPALQSLFFEGLQSPQRAQRVIGRFVAARKLSGHPVAVHPWERKDLWE
ncbi:hypothetical protein BJV74DRAFT_854510 [Russula compacta]|nr:hypothetical protein BJV74DRAFT_854510 [Russula compacta]